MDKPELDYAFLADFARVENNKLTAVGASYTHVMVPSLPGEHQMYVAGRIRCPVGMDDIELKVDVHSPGGEFELGGNMTISHRDSIRPYDGKIGLLFSVGITIPIPAAGLYEVFIDVDDSRARRLAFQVSTQEAE